MNYPRSPQGRPSIHSHKMGGKSGDFRQSPSSSQGMKRAKEDGSTSVTNTDSKGDDDYDRDSGIDDTKERDHTKENAASPNISSKPKEILKQEPKYVMHYHKVACIIVTAFVAVYLGYEFSTTTQATANVNEATANVNETYLREAIKHVREEFPSQLESIWKEFSAGIIETVLKTPTKPSVFMLLYETEDGTAICLAQKVGNMFTRLLVGEKSNPLLILDGADLEYNETLAEDYGILVEEYRTKVEEQHAMIINNLHKIPGTVAQSFHSFCDTVTPAVDKAVYLFTMKASGVSNRHSPTEVAEKELRKLWSGELDEDKLNPLITRITDVTMMIRPEKNLVPC